MSFRASRRATSYACAAERAFSQSLDALAVTGAIVGVADAAVATGLVVGAGLADVRTAAGDGAGRRRVDGSGERSSASARPSAS